MRYLIILILVTTTVSCSLQKNKPIERLPTCSCGIHMPKEDWISSEITRYEVQESERLTDSLTTISGFIFDKRKIEDTINVDTLPHINVEYKTINERYYTRGVVVDRNGYYTVSLTPGIYDFRVSFVAYNTLQLNNVIVMKHTNVKLDFTLGQGFSKDVYYMHSKDKKIYKVEE